MAYPKFRDGVQVIVYRIKNLEVEFLLLHRVKNWKGWEFPKGGREQNEKYRETVIRELREECNINGSSIVQLYKTNHSLVINYPEDIVKKTGYDGALYQVFLVRINDGAEVSLDTNNEIEHDEFKWVNAADAKSHLSDKKLVEDVDVATNIISNYKNIEDYGEQVRHEFGDNL